MKVLFIYPGFRKRASRLQYDFIVQLKKHCDLKIYGAKVPDDKLSTLKFDENRSIRKIVDHYKPDVLLFHMWEMYQKRRSKNMPPGIEEFNEIPKVMFEVDYWSLPDYDWYRKIGFNLIIQRGWFKEKDIPSVWLPFSATKEFYPIDNKKKNEIFFVGGVNKKNPLYDTRRKAIEILSKHKLLNNKSRVGFGKYPDFIREFTCGLSCGCSIAKCPVGKTFEYMAAGVATLCSPMHGQEILFDGKECMFEYNIDCSNIVEVAKLALNDIKRRKYIVNNAIEIAHKQHMDEHRIIELHDILEAISKNKIIPKKWSH